MNRDTKKKVLMAASVASMIDQFNIPNICLLQKLGYEVHVACNFRDGNTCDRIRVQKLQELLKQMGVVYYQWDCPRNIASVSKCVKAYKQLQQIIRHRYVWMHCHSPVGGALARIAAHRVGIPVVYTAHGFHFYRGAPFKNWLLYYPAEKLLAYWTDVLITVNREDYRLAKRKLKAGKVCYIPGVGVDVGKYKRQAGSYHASFRRKYQISKDAVILLSVGELSRRKNHQIIISALPELSGAEVHYMICGQGKLKGFLSRKAKRLGVAGQVHILGFQENITDFYCNADLFVFPSRQEGMPVALMEAMASGLPCVVSDIRGNRELFENGKKDWIKPGGIIFSIDQPDQLRAALEVLLKYPRLRQELGSYNRKRIQAFDLVVVNQKMAQIYDSMGKYDGKTT